MFELGTTSIVLLLIAMFVAVFVSQEIDPSGEFTEVLGLVFVCTPLSWYLIFEFGWDAVFAFLLLSMAFIGVPLLAGMLLPLFVIILLAIFLTGYILGHIKKES